MVSWWKQYAGPLICGLESHLGTLLVNFQWRGSFSSSQGLVTTSPKKPAAAICHDDYPCWQIQPSDKHLKEWECWHYESLGERRRLSTHVVHPCSMNCTSWNRLAAIQYNCSNVASRWLWWLYSVGVIRDFISQ